MKSKLGISLILFISLATSLGADDAVRGITTNYQSYYGVEEQCVQISKIPEGAYSDFDIMDETELCNIDLYSENVAICAKNWSTSAAVVIYDISSGRLAGERTKFQEKVCPGGKVAKYVAKERLARIKLTMNQEGASNVFTPSPILYYHLSRYFGLLTKVPVGVWRSIDKNVFLNEVALSGVALSGGRNDLIQNNMGWQALVDAIADPASYERPGSFGSAEDIITADGKKVYGVMYRDQGGDPYGPELNGIAPEAINPATRIWAFKKTPVMIALSTDATLSDSIKKGLTDGAVVLQAGEVQIKDVSDVQMAFWMREMSEILLLDFILNQQDRFTNIDYNFFYYWVEGGIAKSHLADKKKPGESVIPADAILIARSEINDNDAGGRPEYDNLTRDFRLLDSLRHFDFEVYSRLLDLNLDLQNEGPVRQWLNLSLGLEQSQVEMIVSNTQRAAEILYDSCQRGELRFDLAPEDFLATGVPSGERKNCTSF